MVDVVQIQVGENLAGQITDGTVSGTKKPLQHLQEQGFDTLTQGITAQAGELVPLRNDSQQQGMAIVDRLGSLNGRTGPLGVCCHSMALWPRVATHQ